VKLCAKIPQIMCNAFEIYGPSFCQLCKNYSHHFLSFVLHIFLFKINKTASESDYSAIINKHHQSSTSGWLTVTCRLTACTPGSAPGPTLGVEYGKPLPLPFYQSRINKLLQQFCNHSNSNKTRNVGQCPTWGPLCRI